MIRTSKCKSLPALRGFASDSYVDAIAIDAAFIINDIARVDADPVLHLPAIRR